MHTIPSGRPGIPSNMLTSQSITEPKTGREFVLARSVLGVSARRVALELGITVPTLQRWETGTNLLTTSDVKAWRKALATSAQFRAEELGRTGLAVSDISRTEFGRTLALYCKGRRS